MSLSKSFQSLAGVRPGVSTVSEALERFGDAEVSETAGGGLFYDFADAGVRLTVDRPRNVRDPVVDEVQLSAPWGDALPCGVRLGQTKAAALAALRRAYGIVREFEDAVYFRPFPRSDLLGAVEFLDCGVVMSIQLMVSADVPCGMEFGTSLSGALHDRLWAAELPR